MKNIKKYLPFIFFVIMCILIYAKFGIINVKAETEHMIKDNNNNSIIYRFSVSEENHNGYGDLRKYLPLASKLNSK